LFIQVSELRAESEELSEESTAAAKQAAAEKQQLLQQISDLEVCYMFTVHTTLQLSAETPFCLSQMLY
jgi:hypothetical protein